MTHAAHSFDALMDITARPQVVFVRGKGSYLWDESGKRYLDFVQGWAVNCLGHCPEPVIQAISRQAQLSRYVAWHLLADGHQIDVELQLGKALPSRLPQPGDLLG